LKSTKKPRPKASIIVLTRNSARTIGAVLKGIQKQTFKDYEVIVIDSSSTDTTCNIAKSFGLNAISIKPNDFGHGKTRNYGINLAKGDFVLFLTHDSVPETEDWLSEMLKPFDDDTVAGVYGRQIPKADENLLDKHFQLSLYGKKRVVWESGNWTQGDNLFSDANSAVRKSIIIKTAYPNDIIVSEDYYWAIQVLELGFKIVYSPSATVLHSHSYNITNLFKRNFDVGVSFKTMYATTASKSFMSKGLNVVLGEIKYLIVSGNGLWVPVAILRDGVRFIAIITGKHEQYFSKKFKKKYLSSQTWYWK
jgi:rhamnosyltransferase